MTVAVSSQDRDDLTIISVEGELDISSARALRTALDEAITRGRPCIAVDLEKVGFMDSSALDVVLSRLKFVTAQEGHLALVAPNDRIRRVLSITGLDGIIEVHPSMTEFAASQGCDKGTHQATT